MGAPSVLKHFNTGSAHFAKFLFQTQMHGKDKLLHLSSNSSRHDILLTDELNRAQDDKTQTNKGKKNKNKKIKKIIIIIIITK